MHDGASGNFIGGAAAGAGNVISANTYRGIYAYGTNTSYNLIQGNFIGTAANGTSPLGNNWDGVVFFDGASSNVVGLSTSGAGAGNTIAFNGFTGVYIGSDNSDMSIGDTIRGNTIFSNNYIGINLAGGTEDSYGVTANHPGGAVPGPNDLQNYPIITNAVTDGTTTTISGTLNSSASRSFLIDVYRNPAPDPSGHGQGQVYVGSATVLANVSGDATFSLAASGDFSGQVFLRDRYGSNQRRHERIQRRRCRHQRPESAGIPFAGQPDRDGLYRHHFSDHWPELSHSGCHQSGRQPSHLDQSDQLHRCQSALPIR